MATEHAAAQIMARAIAEPLAERAVATLLAHLGQDPRREGLRETPRRVVRALRELTSGYGDDPKAILSTSFEEGASEMIMVRDVAFQSLCEHHLLPFIGRAHVAYIPQGTRVVGLSKLARLVECFARRLQVQERITHQIASALMEHTDAIGAAVLLEASHGCMAHRGVRQPGAAMVTCAVLGVFHDDARARAEFMSLTRK